MRIVQISIQNDIGYFSATANAITSLIIESLILIGLLILIITTQFSSTLSALLFMGIFGLLFLKITNNFNIKLGNNVHIASKERFKSLIEGFAGIKDIIVFNKVSLFIKSFEKANKKLINAKKYHTIVSSLPRILIEILLICTFVAIIFVFLSNNLSIEQSLPTLGFFAAASFRLAPSRPDFFNTSTKN